MGPSSTGLNTKYRACREYTKGTQARSPTDSMNPKPSVVMSIVVKIAGCARQEIISDKIERKVDGWRCNIDLVVQPICDIPALEGQYKPHRVSDMMQTSMTRSLFACHANVDQDPKNKPWSELIERFDIEIPNRRVKFSADEELDSLRC